MDHNNVVERKREMYVLAVYALYTVIMSSMTLVFDRYKIAIPIVLSGLVISIIFFIKQYKDYEFRAMFASFFMWVNMSLYLAQIGMFIAPLALVSSMILLISAYGIIKPIYLSAVCFSANVAFHIIYMKDITIGFSEKGLEDIVYIAAVYFAMFLAYQMIKAQHESNDTLMKNMDRIKSAEQSKDDFMANVSHEIRTPINTVYGISEMMQGEELPESFREKINDIQTAGRQLLSIVSDILDFSELSSGKVEIIPEKYNISSTVNDILNMTLANAANKDIEIVVDCDPGIPCELIGDEAKIRRAIMNVLNNAVKFTNEGGIAITFTFRKETYGGNLIVTVEDTGIGMTKETLETLFSKYNQVDSKRNRKTSGLGLGLAITKYIIKAMGGFLTVKSVYGTGTYVRMTFPQKIGNEEPVARVEKPEEMNAMVYIDIEQYSKALIRDRYMKCIAHLAEGLKINYRGIRTLPELKRRAEKEKIDFLFIDWKKYCEDRDFYETLSENTKVILVLERDHRESVLTSRLLCVYKPFYSLAIVSVLNGSYVEHISRIKSLSNRFTAPLAKVLIVDDNLMNLKVLEGLLRPYGLKVYSAESGREALLKTDEEHFDMIFMDHMMPEMDGIETFHHIRQKQGTYYKEVPIVALTANAVAGAREMFIKEGFADYVSKPIEVSQLDRVLNRFIPDFKKQAIDAVPVPANEDTDAGNDHDTDIETDIKIEGLDIAAGLQYCGGNMDDYVRVVRTYADIADEKLANIRESFGQEDYQNYIVYVHAVKSTSYGIGAAHLGGLAEKLESAGNGGDIEYIRKNNDEMVKLYEKTVAGIRHHKVFFPDEDKETEDGAEMDVESLKQIGGDVLGERLSEISALIRSLDQDKSTEMINELCGYQYNGRALLGSLAPIRDEILDFDYDKALDGLKKISEKL